MNTGLFMALTMAYRGSTQDMTSMPRQRISLRAMSSRMLQPFWTNPSITPQSRWVVSSDHRFSLTRGIPTHFGTLPEKPLTHLSLFLRIQQSLTISMSMETQDMILSLQGRWNSDPGMANLWMQPMSSCFGRVTTHMIISTCLMMSLQWISSMMVSLVGS